MQRRGHLGSSGKRRGAIELGIEHGHDERHVRGRIIVVVRENERRARFQGVGKVLKDGGDALSKMCKAPASVALPVSSSLDRVLSRGSSRVAHAALVAASVAKIDQLGVLHIVEVRWVSEHAIERARLDGRILRRRVDEHRLFGAAIERQSLDHLSRDSLTRDRYELFLAAVLAGLEGRLAVLFSAHVFATK